MNGSQKTLRDQMYTLIFTNETAAGRLFDKTLIALILISLVVVLLNSVQHIARDYHTILFVLEWMFTILFSVEYAARLYCAKNRRKYATSFFR